MRFCFIIKKNSKSRKCKRNVIKNSVFCFQHKKIFECNNTKCRVCGKKVHSEICNGETEINEYGECCFCGKECNPMSQSCGRCARKMTYLRYD